jgi:hypothetical protein
MKKIRTCRNLFGDGTAAGKMVKILKDIPLDERFIQKQITY